MYKQPYKQVPPQAKELRKKAGAWIARLRKKAGLTQRELAVHLGLNYYTYISQVENGDSTLASHHYEKCAKIFGMDCAEFGKEMLRYYDPFTYKCIFGVPKKK